MIASIRNFIIPISILLLNIRSIKSASPPKCSSISCVHAAAKISENLDTETDPCEDFYQFACGGFLTEIHTPDEKSVVSTKTIAKDKVQENLLRILQKPISDFEDGNAKKLFENCMNVDAIQKRGNEPLISLLDDIGGWPMMNPKLWNENKWDWGKMIKKFREKFVTLEEEIFKDTENLEMDFSEFEANEIHKPNIKFSDGSFEANLIMLYQTYIKNTVKSFLEYEMSQEDEEDLNGQIKDLLDFEFKLGFYLSLFVRTDETPKFLQKLFRQIKWINFLSPFQLSSLDIMNLGEDPVGKELTHNFLGLLMVETSERTKANFIAWRLVQLAIPLLDEDHKTSLATFKKFALGEEDSEEHWRECVQVTSDLARESTNQIYLQNYFKIQEADDVKKIAGNIKDFLLETISNLSWMDDTLKSKIIEKFKNISVTVGAKKYNSSYGSNTNLGINEGNFFEQVLGLSIFNADDQYKSFFDKHIDWTQFSAASLEVTYDERDLILVIPVGILQSPFYNKDKPNYLNYAGIGVLIGQTLLKVFEEEIKDKSFQQIYNENLLCFINQYNSIKIPDATNFLENPLYLNGPKTIKNDIADYVGAFIAYKAYGKSLSQEPEKLLIGLTYEPANLFWINFAQSLCSVERISKLVYDIKTSDYSPNRYRVTETLKNLPNFAGDFKCQDGSQMNPLKKCNFL